MTKIITGDCRIEIPKLDDNSIDCIMTSPPYWGLRDYGHSDQLGLESTPEEYLENMLNVFDLVKPKLKKTGTCFVNLGDTYMSSGGASRHKGYSDPKYSNGRTGEFNEPSANKHPLIKPKSLCMIPERFAWGMIEHGWILRNKPIWWKKNHMPESVTDRFTKAYENIYFFTKTSKYDFDLDAVREQHTTQEKRPSGMVRSRTFNYNGKYEGNKLHEDFGSPRARTQRKPYAVAARIKDEVEYRDNLPSLNDLKFYLSTVRNGLTIDEVEEMFGNQAPHHWFSGECYPSSSDWIKLKEMLHFDDTYDFVMTDVKLKPSDKVNNDKGKNPGDVWQINTQPYKEAHFAVFPLKLVEKPILAGCPVGGRVLDMFGGSGTVADFCRHNDRECTIIELNEEYTPLIKSRSMADTPLLSRWAQ